MALFWTYSASLTTTAGGGARSPEACRGGTSGTRKEEPSSSVAEPVSSASLSGSEVVTDGCSPLHPRPLFSAHRLWYDFIFLGASGPVFLLHGWCPLTLATSTRFLCRSCDVSRLLAFALARCVAPVFWALIIRLQGRK